MIHQDCVEAETSIKVYGVGTLTDDEVTVNIYADIANSPVVSFGVNLIYNFDQLTVQSALKNEDDWYFGDQTNKHAYIDPDTSIPGSVVIIGGKLDIDNPIEGVIGNNILLGTVVLNRNDSSHPVLSLTFGREGNFSNFVTIDKSILDNQVGDAVFLPVVFSDDSDSDGLPDDIEALLGTDPFDADSDDDGIVDGNEDKNQDGVIDSSIGETDPTNPDSDGDGFYDGTEIGLLEPQNIGATDLTPGYFVPAPYPGITSDPNDSDTDDDTFNDLQEIQAGSNPANIDSYPDTTIVDLKKGFNLISIPGDPAVQPDLALDWLPIIGDSSEIDKVMAYDKENGHYLTVTPDDVTGPAIVEGEGLVVMALQDKTVTFTSVLCSSYDLMQGTNIMGFACIPDGYSAFKLLNDLGVAAVASVQRFNPDDGKFESAAFDQNGSPVGVDFLITRGEGYIINMKQSIMQFEPVP